VRAWYYGIDARNGLGGRGGQWSGLAGVDGLGNSAVVPHGVWRALGLRYDGEWREGDQSHAGREIRDGLWRVGIVIILAMVLYWTKQGIVPCAGVEQSRTATR
jgi:hypothetical protein